MTDVNPTLVVRIIDDLKAREERARAAGDDAYADGLLVAIDVVADESAAEAEAKSLGGSPEISAAIAHAPVETTITVDAHEHTTILTSLMLAGSQYADPSTQIELLNRLGLPNAAEHIEAIRRVAGV